MMKYFLLFLFCFTINFIGKLYSQEFTAEDKEILTYQDTRTFGENDKLLTFLNSSDEKVVIRTLIALANISDTSAIEPVGKLLLNSPSSKIRSTSAFALGMMPCQTSLSYLELGIEKEKNPDVIYQILDSYGKIGNEENLEILLNYNALEDKTREGVAISIARFAYRKITSDRSIQTLLELQKNNNNQNMNRKVAYAFYRIRQRELLEKAKNQLLSLTKSEDEYVRMWSFPALAYAADISDIDYILKSLEQENDWRVKVNILTSLSQYKFTQTILQSPEFADGIENCLFNNNPHVRINALTVIGNLYSSVNMKDIIPDKIKLILITNVENEKTINWQETGEAISSYARIFKDDSKQLLFKKYKETGNNNLKPFIIGAFRYFRDASIYKEVRNLIFDDIKLYNETHRTNPDLMIQNQEHQKIYAAFIEMLASIDKKVDDTEKNNIRLIYSEFLGSKDAQIVDLCLTALKDSIYSAYYNETNSVIIYELKQAVSANNFDAMLLLINAAGERVISGSEEILMKNLESPYYEIAKASAAALKKITGKNYTFQAKMKIDFDWEFLKKFKNDATIKIRTEKGDIRIKLNTEMTVFTSMNFIKLIQKKFFDGTTFHRVVSNFVIQGGDPSGSGYGSPGYTIRTEIYPFASFEEGSFGMASDGKDTEGCQFFIMHSPHYHLDGKYTNFGTLMSGTDVLDNVIAGDKIFSITVE